MAQYRYSTILYTDTANVVGLDVTQNNSDLSDYTTNYQVSTVKVDGVTIASTTFDIGLSYTNFKTKIASPITWADVREITYPDRYELVLVSSVPI